MAQIYVGTDGSQIIPGATASIKVQTANAGLATSGVVVLIGEADAGPDYSLETDLDSNGFGPDQLAAVVSKYKSGALVDAFRAAVNPMDDANIQGSPSKIVLVKTNAGAKASASLLKYDSSTYGTLADRTYGKLGNLIYFSVAADQSESLPTTSSFTWIPSVGTVNVALRVNGGSAVTANLTAAQSPASVVSTLNALSGVAATGGAARTTIQNSTGTLALAVVGGDVVTVTLASSTFTTTPSVGDTMVIPAASILAGAANANVGAYVVTAATSTVITATKLSDAAKVGGSAGTITAPAAVSATSVSSTAANDMVVYGPVTVTLESGNPTDGIGKTLEFAELSTGTDLLSRCAYQLGTTTAVTWVSKSGAPKILTSVAEYVATLSVARQADSISEDLTVGGEIGLKIGYQGTTATVTIAANALTTSVSGGSGANLGLKLTDYATLNDLASYINAQTGYTCAVGSASVGQLPSTSLDRGTFGICSHWGTYTGRIKTDAYRFYNKLVDESALVQLGTTTTARADAGLPAPTSAVTYLSGGTLGATAGSDVVSALAACEKVECNFVVPCFSRDATDDITDGLTDVSSTYTIAGIHAATRTHVLAMSKVKRSKNRFGILSFKGSFSDSKDAAASMATPRCVMAFLDQKMVGSDGNVAQFPPYIDAAIIAGGQSAAFYRSLTRKFKNVTGSLQDAGDWSDLDQTAMEDALKAGLMPTKRHPNGGYYFVSDQTTYSKDSNFVYNSLQAMYVADIIALTTKQRMEDAFCGQTTSDVNATAAKAFLEAVMADFMRLKLLAASDDAPLGYKNATVTISGTAMVVNVEIKLAGAIYFIPISFLVSQVSQTATQ